MNVLNNRMMKVFYLISLFMTVFAVIYFPGKSATAEKEGSKWQLIFEDNFDTFDRSAWITEHHNGNRTIWSNKELQWYKDENVYSENGVLKLVVKKESLYGKDVESEKQFEYTSGMICDSKSLSQTYGKWEMRVRFPFKGGYWPAFYLVPLTRPTLPEIDVFEYFGIKENEISCTVHWGKDYGLKAPDYNMATTVLQGDYSDTWMVWAVEVTPKKIVWKLNNKEVKRSTQGLPTTPMYMIANVALKDRPEDGISTDKIARDAAQDPYVMEIDYVKIYKYNSQ